MPHSFLNFHKYSHLKKYYIYSIYNYVGQWSLIKCTLASTFPCMVKCNPKFLAVVVNARNHKITKWICNYGNLELYSMHIPLPQHNFMFKMDPVRVCKILYFIHLYHIKTNCKWSQYGLN